jgi:type IV fimbrial biogenesis protein FimT
MPKKVAARSGITIVELVVVLVVVGVVLSIGMPRIDLTRARMDSGFRQLGIKLLAAQRLAIMRQHAVVVAFDTVRGRMRLHEDRNNDGAIQSTEPVTFVALEEGLVFGRGTASALAMGDGPITFVKRQDGMPAVTFTRSGSAGEFGGFYVTSGRGRALARYASDARAFQVARATGRVFQFQYSGGTWRRKF